MDTLPYQSNRWLHRSYSLIAPLYDMVIARALLAPRKRSLSALPTHTASSVLVSGVGTGLDLPLLPRLHRYTALDFNAGMLARAKPRTAELDIRLILGDSMALPFADASFDHVLLHLIVAVVPEPQRCLREAARVLRPGGTTTERLAEARAYTTVATHRDAHGCGVRRGVGGSTWLERGEQ
jgi:phosphatidylethanolamine/phosphatidyl-N-methylethanolamine N-methyltransferase